MQRIVRERVRYACLMLEKTIKGSMKLGGRTESGIAELRPGTKTVMQDPVSGKKAGKIGSYASKEGEVPRTQTGRLRGSITHQMERKLALPIGYVGTNVKYAKGLEFGTPPHTIRVKNAKVLASKGQFFGKKVKHPGTAPRPFMRPALHKMIPIIRGIFSRRMQLGPPL